MAKKKHKKNITGLRDDSTAKAVETAPTYSMQMSMGCQQAVLGVILRLILELRVLEDEPEAEDEDVDEGDVEDEVIEAGQDSGEANGLPHGPCD
jgi:hypothetical protein